MILKMVHRTKKNQKNNIKKASENRSDLISPKRPLIINLNKLDFHKLLKYHPHIILEDLKIIL